MIIDHRNFDGNISNLVIITVPADGLALLGDKTPAGTVMTKTGSHTA